MKTQLLVMISRLSNEALLVQVQHLARHEREATASLVAHLAELDERRLYLGQGCSSLFAYCVDVLHLSESAAYGRIQAARAARKFPLVLELLESGAINLTTLLLLAPHLTASNHVELFEAAKHQNKRRVQELVAALQPQPDVPSSIRKKPVPSASRAAEAARVEAAPALDLLGQMISGAGDVARDVARDVGQEVARDVGRDSARDEVGTLHIPNPAPPRAVIVPLAPERYKVQFTASAQTHDKLRRAQELLRHQIPNGDSAAVFDRALTVLLAHLEKTKLGATARPRPGRATRRGSRHIPAGVRRVAWQRDGGRCGFVSSEGRRCNEPGFSEFHHVQPHGDGGEPSIPNIEIRCRAHNQYEAELYFGTGRWVNRKRPGGRAGAGEDGSSEVREASAPYSVASSVAVDDRTRREELRPDAVFGSWRREIDGRAAVVGMEALVYTREAAPAAVLWRNRRCPMPAPSCGWTTRSRCSSRT